MHATVLYRRDMLLEIGGYQDGLRASEDYDVYLKLAKRHPVGCHPAVAAEYRQHGTNTTGNPALMLETGVNMMKSIEIPPGNRRLSAARRVGLNHIRRRHGLALFRKIVSGVKTRRPMRETWQDLATLVRLVPPTTFLSKESAMAAYRLLAGPPERPCVPGRKHRPEQRACRTWLTASDRTSTLIG